MKKTDLLLGLLILCITVGVRLYRLNEPIADWHSFRQADTASVALEFMRHGVDLLHPTYHDLSNIQSGKDNPHGYRMVEFPLYQAVTVILAKTYPKISLDVWLRLVSIGCAAGTALLLLLLGKQLVSVRVGFISAIMYAVLPYSVFYGRSVFPETMAVFFAVSSIYLSLISMPGKTYLLVGSGILASLVLLVKPTAAFLLLPVPFIMIRNYGITVRTAVYLLLYGAVSMLPFVWWRKWILQFPEGIPVFEWLFNKGDIRFKGAWFQWLFAERLGKLILGYWGLVPFGLGMLLPFSRKEGWVLRLMSLGGLLYLSVIAAGNVQHDYYQIILLPIVCLYLGKGYDFLMGTRLFSTAARHGMMTVSLLFMLAFSWYTMRTFYWINRPEIIEAGVTADTLLPVDAKVIAPYNGDTTFLYQTKRKGWPLGFDIDKKIAMGATHYVTVSPTDSDFETKELAAKYTVMVRNERFAIIDLTRPHK